jgi:hypothetical protein
VPSVVHAGNDGDNLPFAEVADADGRVGADRYSKSPRVRGLELARGCSCREFGVPEDRGGGRQLAGDAQRRASGSGSGGWLRRFGGVEIWQVERVGA